MSDPNPSRRCVLQLCILVLCSMDLAGAKKLKVQSKRCDMKTKFMVNTQCTSCAASKTQPCPTSWMKDTRGKGQQGCSYTVNLGETAISLSGCNHVCRKELTEKSCCPGFWGSECYECPGGAQNPCSGHGTCLEGIAQNGTCQCEEGFSGFNCQECQDENMFGSDCKSVCDCQHGRCNNGIAGDGSCLCFAGYTGPRCDQELPICKALNCPEHSQCMSQDQTAPSCKCLPGYQMRGGICQALDPCTSSPCSLFALCKATGGQRYTCTCKAGYQGDGKICQGLDPCTVNYGGCPRNSTLCVYRSPGKSICVCKSGMYSPSGNALAGCLPSSSSSTCRSYRCDRSATCQVNSEGKVSCVCKEGEIGDGRSCYGHVLKEVEKLNSQGRFYRKLQAAHSMLEKGCRDVLTKSGPFTVLVPTSYWYLKSTSNETIPWRLCRLHIIPGLHLLEEMSPSQSQTLWTLAGEPLTLTAPVRSSNSGFTYKYEDQPNQLFTITQADLPASNGYIHIVNSIRSTPYLGVQGDPQKTIAEILASMEVFSRFETILENCGLPTILDGPGPFTVFSPSNQGVDSLRDGRLIYLFTKGLNKLQELVKHHIYSTAAVTADKLITMSRFLTTANQIVAVNVSDDGRILLGDSRVPLRSTDILASNGIIHILDGVLLPPSILPILPHRCNREQHKIVSGSCVDCQALNSSVCPPNSVQMDDLPKDCVYVHDPLGLNLLKKGCARYCNQTILNLDCCKGFFGPDCTPCPGGFTTPCYGKGNCSDGIQGNGNCQCFKDFKGIACHICSNPNRHGEQCQEECGCRHGICDNRPGSGGVCQTGTCKPGFTGVFCNETILHCGPSGLTQYCHSNAFCVTVHNQARCSCLPGFEGDGFSCYPVNICAKPERSGCSENADCIPVEGKPPVCQCHRGWSGDGKVCVAIDNCVLPSRGGCHADADCSYVGPGQNECMCKRGFAGDGFECNAINPCRAGNGGCHGLATCKFLGQGQRECVCPKGYAGDGLSCYRDILGELERNSHFATFYEWIKQTGFSIPPEAQVTALVPSEAAVRSLSREEEAMWLQPHILPFLVRSHFLNESLTEAQLQQRGGQKLPTLNSPTYWEISNSRGKITIQNTSLEVADLPATNGIMHILTKVLFPPLGDVPAPRPGLREQLEAVPSFSRFKWLLQYYHVLAKLEAADSFTVFVPTNQSVEEYERSADQKSLDANTVKYHVILGETLTPSDLRSGVHKNSMLGPSYWLMFYNINNQTEVNHVPVSGPFLETRNGVVIGVSSVLTVHKNRCPSTKITTVKHKCGLCNARRRCPPGFNVQEKPQERCPLMSWGNTGPSCLFSCVKTKEVPECCEGYYGPMCEPCPGRPGAWCSGNGQCQGGIGGKGECRCHEGFHGTACEVCELGRYGPDCARVCNCGSHGQCQDGLHGDGRCICKVGWIGPRCDQEIKNDLCNNTCHPSANCVNGTAVALGSCVCSAGYMGNGIHCSEIDPCASYHGGCSPHANCTKVAPGERICSCREGYSGDGELCLEIDGCLNHNGGCHAQAECVRTGPNQVACNCLPNFFGDGIRSCEPINPCAKNNGGCSLSAVCNSTGVGERTCTCIGNTIGDGITCRTNIALELLLEKGASFFSQYILEFKELLGEGPYTVFVPHETVLKNVTKSEARVIQVHRKLLFRYHVVGCQQLLSSDLQELQHVTTLSGHTLSITEREGTLFINEFAKVITSDQVGVNGVFHFIDEVLLPPEVVNWNNETEPGEKSIIQAAESFGYTIFSKMLVKAGLLSLVNMAAHQPFTMLWPTDAAFNALPAEQQVWLNHIEHRDKLAYVLKAHMIRDIKALATDLPLLGELRTMYGSVISFSCSKARVGDILVADGDARLVQRHMEFAGGIAYGIDRLLEPPGLGARCDHYVIQDLPEYKINCSPCGLELPCPTGSKEKRGVERCWHLASYWGISSFVRWPNPLIGRFRYPNHNLGGCRKRCVTSTWKMQCCKNHYGPDCQVCPGGLEAPCNRQGLCQDGMSGTGSCLCNPGFTGVACELCIPGRFGAQCQECNCNAHGRCDDGVSGSGFCFCSEGWSGVHCETRLEEIPTCSPPCDLHAVCRPGNICECDLLYEGDGWNCSVIDRCQGGHCSPHATCSQTGLDVNCTCLPNYQGDGKVCSPRDRCADGRNGDCSEHADCISTGPNTRRCQCRAGYVGNGVQCLEWAKPPTDRCLDTPGPCHPEAICSDLHFQEKTAGVFHLQSSAGKYNLTYGEAASLCAAQGAQLASLSQLSAAQQLGFHLCLVGWLVNGSAGYATSYPSPNCGNNHVGIVNYGARANLLERWDAYCYRLQDVACRCRDGFVGDGNFCNGKLLDVLADNANYSFFYSMLLDYANMSREGLDFFDFLSDELTYKTLFVPLNSGFGDNMTLSWKDLELHASNTTFLSLNLTHGTILPSHSEGHSLFIGDGSAGNSTLPLGARVVNISPVVEWDIVTFNGIIHSIESPMTVPLEPVAAAAAVTSSRPLAVGVTAGIMVALALILVGGAAYFHFKIKKQGFQFHYFKAEEEADDDFSPWQEGSNPPLITIPNPLFGGHNAFYEPFDDSFPEEDFSDCHRILHDE
ncbi:stabilin-1 isoform X1 [Tachyglossus aculeatus]|uniref:stabilin-1 isoform X1 n=3 Tax=Tachyglossus aculeatus TaxID=9261 RepID=UPI0018F6EEA3|nr:stabilin-1 isoform X1 [Tachyglossus aculeatus]